MKAEYHKIVSCPYNPNHKMPETKLMFHINKGCEDKVLIINISINSKENSIYLMFVLIIECIFFIKII